MQLKGLVKFFTVALILISLYQISFTFLVRNVESAAMAKAKREANATAFNGNMDKAIDYRYNAITDSLQGSKCVGMLFKKYTYQEAKSQELNLGLDLQGGMNVTLDVSLDALIKSLSNNPTDPLLLKSIDEATRLKGNSQTDYVTLLGQAMEKNNPSVKLAYLFTKPNLQDINLNSTNDQVLSYIRKQSNDAIGSTYNVLQRRIDKFGVSQPNINLDKNRGIITVELAGVRNPERVREYLQATARLQFWEMYQNQNFSEDFKKADKALSAYLSGTKEVAEDSTKTKSDTTHHAVANVKNDTGSLSSLLNHPTSDATKTTTKTSASEHPLGDLLSANPGQSGYDPAAVGFVKQADIKKLYEYLAIDVVKNHLPANAKFLVGAENRQEGVTNNSLTVYPVYLVKTQTGSDEAKLEGDHVRNANQDFDPVTGKSVVNMEMDNAGSSIWKKMTGENVGKFVAVSLDDRVYSAPRVQGEIDGGRTQISGSFSVEQAKDLSNILKVGKLPAPAHIVQEQVVGPTLGAENIKAGMNSLIYAFIVIFILMLVYYNTAGIVANIALILNLLFTVGILSALGATLTMPGIAGLVLTIGMAVDTNVIIFERIKEELSGGKSYQQAVADGYKRSYAPVLDGHITQLLTAIILFIAGLGPVKGFATTQIIGLLLSLFCGILVSRLVTDIWMKKQKHFEYFTNLSKSIFRKAHFKFIEYRKYTYIISGIVFALGIGSYFHGYDYGVEFAGGRSYDVHFPAQHQVDEVREKLKSSFGEFPIVKTIGKDNDLNITTTYRIKESGKEVSQEVLHKLYEGLNTSGLLGAATTFESFSVNNLKKEQTVLPTISEALKKDAIKATIASLLAIFFYILLRFRKWQYSLGTIIALLHDVCITLAVFSFLRGKVPFALELDQHFIAAVLTVIGFSMNDTVIVFDRVREYFRKAAGGESKTSVINRAINDTLSRTIMTSLTVFLVILILFIFGGSATKGFAFAMLIGVITGTYSSIFVAAPILVDMDKGDTLKNEVDKEAKIEELKSLA